MAKYRITTRDFERLNNDSGANLLYSNGGFDLLTIVPKGKGVNLKNVLIITYYFPPNGRNRGDDEHLDLQNIYPSYGWNPIILTPILQGNPDPKFNIIQTPYYDVVENWKRRFGLNPKKSLNAQLHIKRKKNQPSVIERFTSYSL